MKALEWFERGNGVDDPFDALGNYWRGFNNLFAGQGQERQLISQFLRAHIDEKFADELLVVREEDAKILISQPVIDMRMNGRDTHQYMLEFEAAETSLDRLVALFMVVYQIRCNFEHGQKSPFRERDIDLCRAACPFVAAVLKRAA